MPPPADPAGTDAFLAAVAAEIRRNRGVEALVFWHAGGWPDDPDEVLDAEEVVFWAEGLIEEGFHLEWRAVALADAPDRTDHLRLYAWEGGATPPPACPSGWRQRAGGRTAG